MKIIDKIKLWTSIITTARIYKKDPAYSIDHCLSWLLTHKIFDIKYECHDASTPSGYKLYKYHELGDKIPYYVVILFGDDQTDKKYTLKLWNTNKWYAFGSKGSIAFWPEYSANDCKPHLICNWKGCVPKKSVVYKLAKLMTEWEEDKSIVHKRVKSMIEWEEKENKSKSTDKHGTNEN